MWALYVTYDPGRKAVLLDLQPEKFPPPRHPGAVSPRKLNSFKDLDAARVFGEVYARSLRDSGKAVAKSVRCGRDRLPTCSKEICGCAFGFDSDPYPIPCASAVSPQS